MVSTKFISKFSSGGKSVSDNRQMVTILIRVRNMVKSNSKWSQMTKW
jgi:hypothetical protein